MHLQNVLKFGTKIKITENSVTYYGEAFEK